MSQQTICHFNKFGFCKFGKQCSKYHEDKVCENKNCDVLKCSSRHPRKCRFFAEYFYCKFGVYCKFSHKRSDDGKAIELLENQIENFKKEIEIKDTEIQMVNKEIMNLERKMDSKISISKQNYEAIEKEIREIKVENIDIKSKYLALQKEIEGIRTILSGKVEAVDTASRENSEITEQESDLSISCGKCDFVAKSEAGLKTHDTVKHKKSLMRSFSKVTR